MIRALAFAALFAAATPVPHPGEPLHERVQQNALLGDFTAPREAGRQPAVIVLGGFEGGVPGDGFGFTRSGYAALAIAYFGEGTLPRSPDLVPVETVSQAVDYLRGRPDVNPERIGIVGISKGSELALLAAAGDPRIKSVVVVSPSAYVWFAPAFDGERDRSSWTSSSRPLPFIAPDERAEAELVKTFQSGGTYAFRDLYDASLRAAPAESVARAAIPAERIRAPILCIAGDDDREWDSAGACSVIAARRKAANAGSRDEVRIEAGAGHVMSLGGRAAPDVIPSGRMKIRLGGNLDANTRAGADAWNRTLSFFARTL